MNDVAKRVNRIDPLRVPAAFRTATTSKLSFMDGCPFGTEPEPTTVAGPAGVPSALAAVHIDITADQWAHRGIPRQPGNPTALLAGTR